MLTSLVSAGVTAALRLDVVDTYVSLWRELRMHIFRLLSLKATCFGACGALMLPVFSFINYLSKVCPAGFK